MSLKGLMKEPVNCWPIVLAVSTFAVFLLSFHYFSIRWFLLSCSLGTLSYFVCVFKDLAESPLDRLDQRLSGPVLFLSIVILIFLIAFSIFFTSLNTQLAIILGMAFLGLLISIGVFFYDEVKTKNLVTCLSAGSMLSTFVIFFLWLCAALYFFLVQYAFVVGFPYMNYVFLQIKVIASFRFYVVAITLVFVLIKSFPGIAEYSYPKYKDTFPRPDILVKLIEKGWVYNTFLLPILIVLSLLTRSFMLAAICVVNYLLFCGRIVSTTIDVIIKENAKALKESFVICIEILDRCKFLCLLVISVFVLIALILSLYGDIHRYLYGGAIYHLLGGFSVRSLFIVLSIAVCLYSVHACDGESVSFVSAIEEIIPPTIKFVMTMVVFGSLYSLGAYALSLVFEVPVKYEIGLIAKSFPVLVVFGFISELYLSKSKISYHDEMEDESCADSSHQES